MSEQTIYRISFVNQGQVYEIYARGVSSGGLFGFVEVEDLVFGERTQMVIDPSEERLQQEFSGVQRTYLPMHSVVRIDQVEKPGSAKITEMKKGAATVTPFPVPAIPGGKES